ncbi:SlyX family protein [uncultured Castellaniella sp.]|uniref:SlyX family protein n=1 Tax=uncultured Castellaniella sp. TaxID=647907 RepID=UPI00260E38E5|nr:SlyX family protein [uncultured Castellaniella sp.]
MSEYAALEARIVELELKATYADDLLDRLNQLVFRQQQQIEAMARQLSALRQQQGPEGPAGARSPQDERPPHY